MLETPTQKTKEVNDLTSSANGFMDMSGKNKKKEMLYVSVLIAHCLRAQQDPNSPQKGNYVKTSVLIFP